MNRADLLQWLQGKLKEAEKSLRAREQAATTWRSGTNESWAAAAKLHPSTAGSQISKAERLKIAAKETAIAAKCRRDVEMFKAAYAAISQ